MMNSYRVFCNRKKETVMESNQVKKYCIIGVIAAAVCLFVMNVKVVIAAGTAVLSAAAPLLFGIVIAYILNILLKQIEKWYFPKTKNPRLIASRRPVSIVLAFMALLVIPSIKISDMGLFDGDNFEFIDVIID